MTSTTIRSAASLRSSLQQELEVLSPRLRLSYLESDSTYAFVSVGLQEGSQRPLWSHYWCFQTPEEAVRGFREWVQRSILKNLEKNPVWS